MSFFNEQGMGVSERPLWEPGSDSDRARTTVHGEDPWRIGVTSRCEDDGMEVVVDRAGEVVEVIGE